jgi:hypothetical protein
LESTVLVADYHKYRYAYLIFILVEGSAKVIMAKDFCFHPLRLHRSSRKLCGVSEITRKDGDFPLCPSQSYQLNRLKINNSPIHSIITTKNQKFIIQSGNCLRVCYGVYP